MQLGFRRVLPLVPRRAARRSVVDALCTVPDNPISDILLGDITLERFMAAFESNHQRITETRRPPNRALLSMRNARPLVLLPLSLEKELPTGKPGRIPKKWQHARWVTFLVDTGSPATFLCQHTLREFDIVHPGASIKSRFTSGAGNGAVALFFAQQSEGHINGINVLGTDVLHGGSIRLDYLHHSLALKLLDFGVNFMSRMPIKRIEEGPDVVEMRGSDLSWDVFKQYFPSQAMRPSDCTLDRGARTRVSSNFRALVLLPVAILGGNKGFFDIPFLIDTGSPTTFINKQTAEFFGVGEQSTFGIRFDHNIADWTNVQLSPQGSLWEEINLLGADILRFGTLLIDYPWGHVELQVPARGIRLIP
eukprot:TRINITY_DN40600_c0_g1_i1.p1 TRINITY_DN40600_c0_g1~~TRINITY_DN40600_c0_g1_i1.p1  ORF type:complete len:364 (+),score=68.01 TRINITY_DN40600_c0_g1_i1:86-1177(+)